MKKRKRYLWRFTEPFKVTCIFFIISLLFINTAFAGENQNNYTIKGKVTDSDSQQPLPGVSIYIKGSTIGTISDFDGLYSIEVQDGDVIVFSFIGYAVKEIKAAGQETLNVALAQDIIGLEEAVVIGYGIQKKKLNTGANINMSGEDIKSLNTSSAMDALQGISPGVSITRNSGQPGAGSKVYIRGIGTIGNSAPLYIVDGVAVGNIDNLSPNDIASIDVLKDAASAAIYGSRAANGVILVTTVKGKQSKHANISFDSYMGWQNITRKPELLDAQQYVEIMNEATENIGRELPDWNKLVPNFDQIESGEWAGVNWLDEALVKNAVVYNHSLNITGGTEQSVYSLGVSYLNEEGIIAKQANSTYKRLNLRLNTEHTLIKGKNFNYLVVGENLTFTNSHKPTIRTGNIYWNDLHNLLVTNPLLPMYDENEEYHYAIDWNPSDVNPIALMEYNGKYNYNNHNTLVGNAYVNIQPIADLMIRSSIGINNLFGSSRQWIPAYDLGPRTVSSRDQVNQSMYSGYTWTLTNTISYEKRIGMHKLSGLVGNEMLRNASSLNVSGHNENSLFNDAEHAYLTNVSIIDPTYTNLTGRDDYGSSLLSNFGRVSYDYNETYLLTLVMRADGSSNFAKGYRWGYFPSVAAGWVISHESFMQSTQDWLNFMKLRASWGQNGNQDIDRFQYLSSLSYKLADYFPGPDKTVRSIGAYPARIPNEKVSWETSEQIDLGLDVHFFNSQLQFSTDLYQKKTYDWLVIAPSLLTNGSEPPFINGGTISNKGIETSLKWQEKVGNFNYSISGSFAYNKNKIVEIKNDEKIIHGPANVLSQGTGEMFRAQEGYPVGYFWGLETDGIFQNEEEVAAYVKPDGTPMFKDVMPGDVRFIDQNHDGVIDNDDKVMIGDPNPDCIFGLQVNLGYKGFYLATTAIAETGMQIAKSYRSFQDSPRQNYTTDIFNRWHGEGTSNTMPRVMASGHRNTANISDLFIEDGDFLRITNLTLGYDLSASLKKLPLSEAKIYVATKNLYTFTKYSGMDPEVGYGPDGFNWASGIDLGLYPSSRVFMVGVSAKF